jgi:hypothetical protein
MTYGKNDLMCLEVESQAQDGYAQGINQVVVVDTLI